MNGSEKMGLMWVMAERTGLEPATPCVTGRYSNQLNYRSKVVVATRLELVTSTL